MLASLAAAVAAALCYGVASVMQAVAVRAAGSRSPAAVGGAVAGGGAGPGLVLRLLSQWRFGLSLVIDLLGFAAQLAALRGLPLFAVQAVVAANLAVIAVLATAVIGTSLAPREWLAVTGVVAGVGLLGASAGTEGASRTGDPFKLALLAATVLLGLGGWAAARRLGPAARTLVLGALSGLGFGAVGLAARVLDGFAPLTLARDPAAYTVVAAGIVAFTCYTAALDGGSVTVATAAVVLTETVPPAVVGVLFLGDTTRPGLAPAAVAGFVLAVASAVLLARFGEAGPPAGPGQPGETAAAETAQDRTEQGQPAAVPLVRPHRQE